MITSLARRDILKLGYPDHFYETSLKAVVNLVLINLPKMVDN